MNLKGEFMRTAVRAVHPIRRRYWRLVKPETFGVKVAVQSPETSEFLLVRHTIDRAGGFTFPGGRYKPKKETPEAAGIREVREELGLAIGRVGIVGEYTSTLEHKRDTITCVHGLIEDGEQNLNFEIADTLWVSADQLQEQRLNRAGREMIKFLRDAELLEG